MAKIGFIPSGGSPWDEYEQFDEIEIPFKVKIKAAFTVCAVDTSTAPNGEILAPKLNYSQLQIGRASCRERV